ncbi:hypothetical protein [Pseudophaeobacter profundi]|uniref:hypothetical protein n=1 Tax=Pseudophaeobacter profundi TaxID=3034152 RepID=UPI00242F3E96|nr:hypothetical protein [Pseudophaeobacter profundi]
MTAHKRYLPLFDETGAWALDRPDLYVLVRMSVQEGQAKSDPEATYRYIAEASDNTKSELNDPESTLEKHYIRGHMTERRYAAMVVTELLRLKLNDEKPTLANALKLITHELSRAKPTTQESSIKSQVKTAFSKWRNTSHLEAAFRISGMSGQSFEADHKQFLSFLAIAKALEDFMDEVCGQGDLSWNPWRVPEQIDAAFSGQMTRLSDEERKLLSTNCPPRELPSHAYP